MHAKVESMAGSEKTGKDRRSEPRLWCSDLVEVCWKDRSRWTRKVTGVLEDISRSGVCVQLDVQAPVGATLRVELGSTRLEGEVRYCYYSETGYFVGVKLAEGIRWSQELFRPKHLLDPSAVKAPAKDRPEE